MELLLFLLFKYIAVNKKFITLTTLVLLALQVGAQYSDTLELFEKKQIVYLLADSVNIRKEPNTESALVAKLPIGTRLTIIDKSKTASRINNILTPWYLVSFNEKEKGYVWGGKIALASFRSNRNPDIVFHFGMESMDANISTITYQIRVEQFGKEMQRLSFKGFGGYFKRHTCTNISNKGLDNVDDIIQVDGYAEACGEDAGAIVLFWANNKLTYVDKLFDIGDGGLFNRNYFVYPADMEGKKNTIIKKEEEGEVVYEEKVVNWSTSNVRYDRNVTISYKWDGSKLVKLK
jgi:hypothetical protein